VASRREIIEECRKLAVMRGENFIKCLEEKGLLKRPREPVFTTPGWPDKERKEHPDKERRDDKRKPPIRILPV
jgi:hypothetical protein